jgi:ABC-type nickel/cobalt efflux system permease component RcnA
MDFLIFIFQLFILFVGGGWLVGKLFGRILFGSSKEKPTYIDKSIHHHHHHHTHHHQNMTVIDEETHKKALDKFNLN